jgi:hypothetical protein
VPPGGPGTHLRNLDTFEEEEEEEEEDEEEVVDLLNRLGIFV